MGQNTSAMALAADIGGTNARFALTDPGGAGPPRLLQARQFRLAEFASIEEAMEAYFRAAGLETRPPGAVMAVAAPIRGDLVALTNHPLRFSISEVRSRFGFERFEVLNDFAAVALSLPHLQAEDLHTVGNVDGTASVTDVMGIVGPGTGLGVGCLVCGNGGSEALASEGGHISFAPGSRLERNIARLLQDRYAHVSYERLLSGPGLVNLYQALAAIEGMQAEDLTPAAITRRGTGESGGLCRRAMDLFCAILGAFAGDVALMFGAGRIFIGGGMAPRFLPLLDAGAFRDRFEAKGRYRDMMQRIPTDVILHRQPGLLGAAAALRLPRQSKPNMSVGSATHTKG